VARGTLGIALACVLLSFLMMITRTKAIPQVIGFLAMENGCSSPRPAPPTACRWWSSSASRSTCWSAMIILGVFMFQIREQFDSLDIRHLEKLKEE
jgi:hydrogenase-4 component E